MKPFQKDYLLFFSVIFGIFGLWSVTFLMSEGFNKNAVCFIVGCFLFILIMYGWLFRR